MNGFQEIFKRIELKYLMSGDQYRALRARLSDIVESDIYGKTRVMNIYLDTPDYFLIRQSVEKPRYKEKIRLRSYGVPTNETDAFVEIKKKYAGVVYKRRIAMPYADAQSYVCGKKEIPATCRADAESAQIASELDYFRSYYQGLAPRVALSYEREAFVGKEDPELRITFDTDLRYRTDALDLRKSYDGKRLMEEDTYLMELKIAGAIPFDIARALSDLQIWQTSYSKYGRAYLDLCMLQMEKQKKITDLNAYKEKKTAELETVRVTG